MKTVIFSVNSTPDRPALGFGDYVRVEQNGRCLFGSHASTCPNPYKINGQGLPVSWKLLYGWIANGRYIYRCVKHKKYGKCLIINGGAEVPSRAANHRQNNRMVLSELFIHEANAGGKNPDWRGSMGCPTLRRDQWPAFIACFEIGDVGALVVENLIEGR